MRISEKQIEDYLKKKVKDSGGLCIKWTSPGTAGVPDRIVILNKKVRFVELKAPDKRNNLSKLQKAVINKIRKCGVDVYILATYEEIDNFIETLAGDVIGI
ncbi:hypothetical protein IX317_000623 [Fusobacterium sp. DD29]|uniref:VRR-NUC domain-containing protein n=1 Tax=unclassified Fusobacterium TaxID=2648384 RepID=UPI001B8AC055|nr:MULTISPECIES: VRR-NUC domain-containing protein [unclassified Fusobacterium]MBR8700255.1 hypothetical protein [Fusobacterium sp. DD45]MBR8710490.1 hypothetical protein [Fusobacterium sp. DD28]MBR8748962.1 hypothetical protein [Fusobacterium sp. DD29]MBR8751060.1 hypothetical protein [Fusobacterium sp. DD26]MBR8761268.1 hypothetical protein [Fusobacterium sp. DD25]